MPRPKKLYLPLPAVTRTRHGKTTTAVHFLPCLSFRLRRRQWRRLLAWLVIALIVVLVVVGLYVGWTFLRLFTYDWSPHVVARLAGSDTTSKGDPDATSMDSTSHGPKVIASYDALLAGIADRSIPVLPPSTLLRIDDDDEQAGDTDSEEATRTANAMPIARILHQTYKHNDTTQLSEAWRTAIESCRTLHSTWVHILWTDDMAGRFIADFFPRRHVRNYQAYPYGIQRVDAMRYYVLLAMGGVYMDMDIGCRRALDPVINERPVFGAVLPKTAPFGVSNDFMMAAAGTPLFLRYVLALPGHNRWFGSKYPTVMFSTGPAFVDLQTMDHLNTHQYTPTSRTKPGRVAILHDQLYGNQPNTSFLYHVHGSSWHAGDADFVLWLTAHPVLAVLSGVILVGFVLVLARRLVNAVRSSV